MFSRPSMTLISFAFLAFVIVGSNSNGVLRRKNRQTHYYYAPVGAEAYSSPDRSVYARRNFGQPDVVSDVYEVYVRPSNSQQSQPKTAVVIVSNGGKGGHDGVYGVLTFTQYSADAPVRINGTIYNLPPGQHGMHVHTAGDLRDGCTSCGPHYNPYKLNHGDIHDRERHTGDLGNIDSNGNAVVDFQDRLISLSGVNSIIGRSMVVHEKRDDGGRGGNEDSKKTGNSGARVACGIIGLAQ